MGRTGTTGPAIKYYDKEYKLADWQSRKVVRVTENGKAIAKPFVKFENFQRATLIKKNGNFYEFILERDQLNKREVVIAFCIIQNK